LASHTRHAEEPAPDWAPPASDIRKPPATAARATAPMAKRSATPVNGGMPRRPTRMAAQVVPQIRVSRTSVA
jgi:hypothetical protein